MDIDKKLKEEFADKKFANDLALALATAKPETKTAAVKNALAMGLEPELNLLTIMLLLQLLNNQV